MAKLISKEELILALKRIPTRSAWSNGVRNYAFDLVDNVSDFNMPITNKVLLNGASNWHQYSESGCAFCYDRDICEALCNNTEKKITKNGQRRPNKTETWLDVQARALFQASQMILEIVA